VKQWMCHIDLHETTDSDQTEFRPAKRAREGLDPETLEEAKIADPIPDGFYLVSDSTNPQTAWQKAMIDSVREVTHIAVSASLLILFKMAIHGSCLCSCFDWVHSCFLTY